MSDHSGMGAAEKLAPKSAEKVEVLFTQYDQPHIAGSLCSKLASHGRGAHNGWAITPGPNGIEADKDGEHIMVPWPRVRVIRIFSDG